MSVVASFELLEASAEGWRMGGTARASNDLFLGPLFGRKGA
jgi:hypothetical protein